MYFLVYFLLALIMWRCTKMDKCDICIQDAECAGLEIPSDLFSSPKFEHLQSKPLQTKKLFHTSQSKSKDMKFSALGKEKSRHFILFDADL